MTGVALGPPQIPEESRRWGDFRGGRAVELPDGQRWAFFEPRAKTRGGVPGWTFGPEVPDDVDAVLSNRLGRILAKWGRAGSDEDQAAAILEAAWFLLARNYEVTPAEFEAIMAGAATWAPEQHEAFAEAVADLIGLACLRSSALAEVA